jgi:hypothetical protein
LLGEQTRTGLYVSLRAADAAATWVTAAWKEIAKI